MKNLSSIGLQPILLAAFGNVLAGNDGFGPRVLHQITARAPAEVELIDLSLQPAALLDHLAGRWALILLDAVIVPDEPACELLDLDCADVRRLPLALDRSRSSHDFGLGWQLTLAQSLDLMPPYARLIGLSTSASERVGVLSEEAALAVPRAAERALEWMERYVVELGLRMG